MIGRESGTSAVPARAKGSASRTAKRQGRKTKKESDSEWCSWNDFEGRRARDGESERTCEEAARTRWHGMKSTELTERERGGKRIARRGGGEGK
eukprot:642229-Pleurochrysis_carterae.AAC.1